jgi:hypothetical protein
MAESLVRITDLNDSATATDQEQLKPGAIPAFIVAFGNGASLGAVSKLDEGARTYLQNAPQGAKVAGNIVGMLTLGAVAAPLVAGLSPVAGGVVLGGGLGAAGGAINTEGSPVTGALVGGALGAVTGGVGGKVAEKVIPIARQVGRNFFRLFSRSMPEKAATTATESALRQWFQKQGITDATTIDNAIASWRKGGMASVRSPVSTVPSPRPVAPAPSAADQIQSIENSLGRALTEQEKTVVLNRWAQRVGRPIVPPKASVEPIAGTEGRGFSVSGTRATPTVPADQPTLAEMSGAANLQVPTKLTRGAVADVGKQFPYYPRGGQASQSLEPLPSVSPPNPNLPTQEAIGEAQMSTLKQALESGDPDIIRAVQALLGNRL